MKAILSVAAAVSFATIAPIAARAQCRPPNDSHEAKLLAFYSVPLVFTSDLATLRIAPGTLRLSAEGAFVPKASADLQRTNYCYTGKAEHTGLAPIFGRPRLAFGLPGGVGVEASYLPSVTIADATPNLGSAAIWITRSVSEAVALTVRAHGTVGTVRGPITCPANALQQTQPSQPCYGTAPSRDEFTADMAGAEVIATGTPIGWSDRVHYTAGLGVNALRPRFRVGFSDLLGGTDRTRILVNLTRFTGFLGAAISITSRCDGSAEAYSSFADVTTVRAFVGCSLLR